jgi:enoyl-[acyl-carrier protein] reductase I
MRRTSTGKHQAFLQNKNILITGLLSSRSIAYGIATCTAKAPGSPSPSGRAGQDRVVELASEFDSKLVLP